MGLFDSIRRVVGGGQSTTDESSAEGDEDPELVDTRDLDVAALRERAEAVAGEVEQLDFSLASLEQFDAAIEAGYDEAIATSDDPETYAWDAFRFGCYLGEVLVRVYDGEWTRDPEWGVTLTGPDDTVTVSVFEVANRSIRTEPVFVAVTERAAIKVGLDGDHHPPMVPDSDDGVTEAGESAGETADESAIDRTTDETGTDQTGAEVTDDDDIGDTADETAPEATADETDGERDEPTADSDETAAGVPSGPDDVGTQTDDSATVGDSGFEFGSNSGMDSTDATAAETEGSVPDTQPEASDAAEPSQSDAAAADRPENSETEPADDGEASETSPTAEAPSSTETATDTTATDPDISESASDGYTNPFEAATEPAEDEPDDAPPSAAESDTESSGADGTAANDAEPADDASDDEPADDDVSSLVDEAEPDRPNPADDAASATDESLFDDDESVGDEPGQPTTATGESGEATSDDPTPDPTGGDGLRAEYAEEAAGFVDFWNEHDLDYTPESLSRLDSLVSAEWDDDRFDDATFGSEATFDDRAFTSVATELGSYFGEVLVRELDGEWSDETDVDSVVVEGPDGPLAIPVFRVADTSLKQQPVFARSYDSLLADIEA